jgi:hypothetical protein
LVQGTPAARGICRSCMRFAGVETAGIRGIAQLWVRVGWTGKEQGFELSQICRRAQSNVTRVDWFLSPPPSTIHPLPACPARVVEIQIHLSALPPGPRSPTCFLRSRHSCIHCSSQRWSGSCSLARLGIRDPGLPSPRRMFHSRSSPQARPGLHAIDSPRLARHGG